MTDRTPPTPDGLACESCGRLPHPPRLRLALAKLAAVFPIELAAHAFFLHHHLPYPATVALLAVTATVLVIWVAEPSAMRLFSAWLHARAVHERRRLYAAPALWRIRTRVPDQPGSLERLSGALAAMDVNILTVDVQPAAGDPLDELVVSAPYELGPDDLLAAVARGGGQGARVWPTSVMALADSQTRALDQAIRVAVDPDELAGAIATLVRARQVQAPAPAAGPEPADEVLKVPWRWGGALLFVRPGEPFTLGERARAQRLAQLAEIVGMARLQLRNRAARMPSPVRSAPPSVSPPSVAPPSVAPPSVAPPSVAPLSPAAPSPARPSLALPPLEPPPPAPPAAGPDAAGSTSSSPGAPGPP